MKVLRQNRKLKKYEEAKERESKEDENQVKNGLAKATETFKNNIFVCQNAANDFN